MHHLVACNSLFEIFFAFGVRNMISANRNSLGRDVISNATRYQNADHSDAGIPNNTGRAITESMRRLVVDCSMYVNFKEIPNQKQTAFFVRARESILRSPAQTLNLSHQKRSAKTAVTFHNGFYFERVDDREWMKQSHKRDNQVESI
jgi:hypothetical protein